MIVDGTFRDKSLTQHPKMALIKIEIENDHIVLEAPDKPEKCRIQINPKNLVKKKSK
jgi:hypothetical protein